MGCLTIVSPLVAAFVPARVFVDKQRCTTVDASGACTTRISEAAEFELVPADAEPVRPRLAVSGITTYPTHGDIYFVTVRQPPISLLDWFATRDNPAVRLQSHYDKYGDRTEDQRIQEGQLQMSGAKEWAIYNALTRAGYTPEFVQGEVLVQYPICLDPSDDVPADSDQCTQRPPSADFLQRFDVITAVDGTKVATLDDLQAVLADHKAGDTVSVTVHRGDRDVTGDVELIQAPGEDAPRAILGFLPVDTTRLQLPAGLTVAFDTVNIGGPSAGLAFTLAPLDAVTPGDLTGGKRVAVTGAIDVKGNVIAIGGLNSKASAVKQMGVKYFIVPASQEQQGYPDNLEAARKVVGDDVQIIPVATLDEALDALAKLGGDPLPAPSTTTSTTTA